MKHALISVLLLSTTCAFAQSLAPDDPAVQAIAKNVVRTGFSNEAIIAFLSTTREPRRVDISRMLNGMRTDLQTGTSSDAPRAASVTEKPGIPDLLALAIDRGAITKTTAGTGLTLTTTPYAIETGFGVSDTPDNFDRNRLARSIALSGTFSSTDVSKGDFSSLTSGELKYAAIGNRSPRDGALMDSVRDAMADAFLEKDKTFLKACGGVLDDSSYGKAFNGLQDAYKNLNDKTSEKVIELFNAELPTIKPPDAELQRCFVALPGIAKLSKAPLEILKKATDNYIKKNPVQLSFSALYVRDAKTSDYYSGKVLYAYSVPKFTLNLNGSSSWNRHDATTTGTPLRKLREYSVESGLNTQTIANVDYSASLKWSRDKAADAKSVGIGEGKAVVHIREIYRLPVSVTYANRETEKIKKGWRLNFGIGALLDDVLRHFKP